MLAFAGMLRRLILAGRHATYAITDQRVIITYGAPPRFVDSLFPAFLITPEQRHVRGNRSSITVAEHKQKRASEKSTVQFVLRDVADVEQAMAILSWLASTAATRRRVS